MSLGVIIYGYMIESLCTYKIFIQLSVCILLLCCITGFLVVCSTSIHIT